MAVTHLIAGSSPAPGVMDDEARLKELERKLTATDDIEERKQLIAKEISTKIFQEIREGPTRQLFPMKEIEG